MLMSLAASLSTEYTPATWSSQRGKSSVGGSLDRRSPGMEARKVNALRRAYCSAKVMVLKGLW